MLFSPFSSSFLLSNKLRTADDLNNVKHPLSTLIQLINIITNWALIWLFLLMNWFHIFKLAFWEKLKLQIEHLNYFLLSWTVPICIFKLPFFENNWNHKLNTSVTYWFSMLFQTTFSRTILSTNWALIWLFSSRTDSKCISL